MGEIEAELTQLENDLTSESQTLEEDIQAKQEALRIRTDVIRAEITTLKAQRESAESGQRRHLQDLPAAEARLKTAGEEVEVWKRKREDLQAQISAVPSQHRDSLSMFGKNLGEVLKTIKASQWHGQEPLGPLGRFVELDNVEQWGDLMRIHIGHQMPSFVVTDARDIGPLQQILSRAGK